MLTACEPASVQPAGVLIVGADDGAKTAAPAHTVIRSPLAVPDGRLTATDDVVRLVSPPSTADRKASAATAYPLATSISRSGKPLEVESAAIRNTSAEVS